MSLPTYSWTSDGAEVSVDDERERPPGKCPPDAIGSITLSSPNETWGEFFTRDQARALSAWLDTLLARHDQAGQ